MTDPGMRVLGLEQAKRNLQALSDKLQNSIVRASLRAAGNTYLAATKAATYGPGRQQRTGLMQRAQSVATSKRGDQLSAKVRMREVSVGGSSGFAQAVRARHGIKSLTRTVTRRGKTSTKPVSMRPFYWWFLEKGTGQRRTASGANRGAITARPWVVPTFYGTSDRAIESFRDTLNRRLEEAANQLPKGVSP
jgi:hypothetical protein